MSSPYGDCIELQQANMQKTAHEYSYPVNYSKKVFVERYHLDPFNFVADIDLYFACMYTVGYHDHTHILHFDSALENLLRSFDLFIQSVILWRVLNICEQWLVWVSYLHSLVNLSL